MAVSEKACCWGQCAEEGETGQSHSRTLSLPPKNVTGWLAGGWRILRNLAAGLGDEEPGDSEGLRQQQLAAVAAAAMKIVYVIAWQQTYNSLL